MIWDRVNVKIAHGPDTFRIWSISDLIVDAEQEIINNGIRIVYAEEYTMRTGEAVDTSLIEVLGKSRPLNIKYLDSWILLRLPEVRVSDFDFHEGTGRICAHYELNVDRFRAKSEVHACFLDLMNELRAIIWSRCSTPLTSKASSFRIWTITSTRGCNFKDLINYPDAKCDILIYPFNFEFQAAGYKVFDVTII